MYCFFPLLYLLNCQMPDYRSVHLDNLVPPFTSMLHKLAEGTLKVLHLHCLQCSGYLLCELP